MPLRNVTKWKGDQVCRRVGRGEVVEGVLIQKGQRRRGKIMRGECKI